tara:strand:- start:476 stop:874 length:399 start_codon:yes stop_codon:yes gene_type:complete
MSVNKLFIDSLKTWIEYDNILKIKNQEIKKIKEEKESLEEKLINFIEKNNLSQTKLTISGSNVILNRSITNGSLSFKLIEEALQEYLKNKSQVEKICSIIKNKKDSQKKESLYLKRKIIKPKSNRKKRHVQK